MSPLRSNKTTPFEWFFIFETETLRARVASFQKLLN